MARSMPEEPRWREDTSPAELALWRWAVDQLPDSVLVLPQVAMTVRTNGRVESAEADLVLLDADGALTVVEVKGGRISYDSAAAVWRNLDAAGTPELRDPIQQVQRASRILRTVLTRSDLHPDTIEWRWVVATPDVRLDAPGGGVLEDVQLWDSLAGGRLAEAYGSLIGERRPHLRAIDEHRLGRLVAALRGRDREGRSTLPSALAAHAEDVRVLTESHRNVLYRFAGNPRVLVRGGAGTGKTGLALHLAAMHAALGERVLLTCWNLALAADLRSSLAAELAALGSDVEVAAEPTGRVVVTDIADLAHRSSGTEAPTSGDLGDWFYGRLPRLLTPEGTGGEFDVVVLDEAQDLSDEWVLALATLVAREGRWFAFMDDQQDLFRVDAPLPDFLEVHHELRENLRNTAAIARFAAGFGEVALDTLAGEGPPVRFVAAPQERVVARTAEVGRRLMRDEGVEKRDLATLWLLHNPSHRRTDEVIAQLVAGEVVATNAATFKGLERPVVVLGIDATVDAPGGRDRVRRAIYTAATRAATLLVVVGDPGTARALGFDELAASLAASEGESGGKGKGE